MGEHDGADENAEALIVTLLRSRVLVTPNGPATVAFQRAQVQNRAVMRREQFDFDPVQVLTAGAFGVPGQRTFFILAAQGRRWVRVWLEKQQLQALADAIAEFIAQLPEAEQPVNAPDAPEASDPSDAPAAEFRAQSLALGWDAERRSGAILVNEGDVSDRTAPLLRCWATLAQLQGFARRADQVCAAGRPPCPLCGLPIDPGGHICPRTNGFHPAFHRS